MSNLFDRIRFLLESDGFECGQDTLDSLRQFVDCVGRVGKGEVLDVLAWLADQRERSQMRALWTSIRDLRSWKTDPDTGWISHETGEFFRVIGLHVQGGSNREVREWCQPILWQKEMGILGLLMRERSDGTREYLLQAKAEPGNIGLVQLSPTLQSTVSNLRLAHGGRKSEFADFFESPEPGSIVYSKFQGEDGGRLHQKENRNMIVQIPDSVRLETPDNYRWISMYAIKSLIRHYENVVNIAVRSIISAL